MAEVNFFKAKIARDENGTTAISLLEDHFMIPNKDDLLNDSKLIKIYTRDEIKNFEQLYFLNKLNVPEGDFRTTILSAACYIYGDAMNIPIVDIDTGETYSIAVNNIIPAEICERYYQNPAENVICIPGRVFNNAGANLQAAGVIARICTVSEIVASLFNKITEASNNIEKLGGINHV